VVRLTANDSLSALLAVELDASLMVMLTNVDGIYTSPPGTFSSTGEPPKLLHTLNPDDPATDSLEFAMDKRVGRGGMAAKVDAAKFALNHGVPSIICNGHENDVLQKIMSGKPVGTFFTKAHQQQTAPFVKVMAAKAASRALVALHSSQRKKILETIVEQLKRKEALILDANSRDIALAEKKFNADGWTNQNENKLAKLVLSDKKLKSIIRGIEMLTQNSAGQAVGKNLKWCKLAEGLYLESESVPLGVVLCVFEARPQVLPEVAALCIASGNAVIFKGSKEAANTVRVFHQIFADALKACNASPDAVTMLDTRSEVSDMLALDEHIDMVIPRGSKGLVDAIKGSTKIPILGDADGVCHVYVHEKADMEMASRIIYDSKVENSAGGIAMGSLLVHSSMWEDGKLEELIQPLVDIGVVVYAGPRARAMFRSQTASMPVAKNMHMEFRTNAFAVEVVESVDQAIDHIREYGSGHTDVIVTEDHEAARKFLKEVDSSCVFLNCSSRFSDGYSFGLGAEVGASNRGHMRGPMGIEGLMSAKWILRGKGHAVKDFNSGEGEEGLEFIHEKKCVTCGLQIRE